MARVFIWISTVLLVILISLLGSYFYYQRLASAAVAQFTRQLPGSMQLVYDSVSADLNGQIEIRDAAVLPSAGIGGARIDRITLHTPGFTYLLTAEKQLASGLLPVSGEIQFHGVTLPLSPANIPLIDSSVAAQLDQHAVLSKLFMACGGHAPLSLQQLYEMGIAQLKSEIHFSYRHQPVPKIFKASLSLNAEDLFQVRSDVQVMSDAPAPSPYMFEHYSGWLEQLDFAYQDRGYHQRRNHYCASLDDDILEQYLRAHRERLVAELRSESWLIDPEVAYAYQRVMSERGDFEFQLKPERALMLTELRELSFKDDWVRLAPRLRLANEWLMLSDLYQEPTSVGMEMLASIQYRTTVEAPSAGMTEDEHRRKTREAIRRAVQGDTDAIREKTYQPVDVSRIGEFIGHWVKLETYFGSKVHGTLERIEGNMLYVDQYMQQGSAVYPIDKTKLARLHVLH